MLCLLNLLLVLILHKPTLASWASKARDILKDTSKVNSKLYVPEVIPTQIHDGELIDTEPDELLDTNEISPPSSSSSSSSSSSGNSSNEQQTMDQLLNEVMNEKIHNDISQIDKDIVIEGLKKMYAKKILPLEIASKFAQFNSPPLRPSDFEAKPMVLILGQYSVGKTSFIRSLLKQDFPGQRIGPEPTTDRFTAIMHSSDNNMESSRLSPGHALVMQPDKPFCGLASFGNNFLSKFEGAEVNAAILKNITIIDTPGVLSGEKQRIGRDYDFSEVVKWFAERADLILVMFDAHKLDISDELKTVLDTLKPHQDKIRIILNKADTIDHQALLRVYGALMWSLGKVLQTPEVCRVYLGSFWDMPLRNEQNRQLLEREKRDLLTEMMSLPQNAVVRRINELVKRARLVKVHAYIVHYLKKQMPYLIGKSEAQERLLSRLDSEFIACARRYNLPLGDFPNVDTYRKILREIKDISGFKKLDKSLVAEMDKVMTLDIPILLQKATATTTTTRHQPPPSDTSYQAPVAFSSTQSQQHIHGNYASQYPYHQGFLPDHYNSGYPPDPNYPSGSYPGGGSQGRPSNYYPNR